MSELVSVIIPVYNVELYLRRCVESVISQSYHNIEIILIDDGSKDSSGTICDELRNTDDRIVVIHQINAGLSAARNKGIDVSHGDYLAFVDSDDWIHPKYIETLLRSLREANSLMSIGDFIKCTTYKDFGDINNRYDVIKREEAIPRMLRGEWISAWAKLYHKSLFDSIRFPVNRNNEDYAILIYLFEKCTHICISKNILYYYFVREGSITHASLNIHSFDEVINGEEIWKYCKMKYPQWSDLALFNLTASIVKLSGLCIDNNNYWEKYNEMKDFIALNKDEILRNEQLPIKYKPFIWSFLLGKIYHRLFLKLYRSYKAI